MLQHVRKTKLTPSLSRPALSRPEFFWTKLSGSRFHKLFWTVLTSLILSACGTPGPGGDSPSNPGQSLNCDGTEIDVIVRATSAMRSGDSASVLDWKRSLFNAVTPTPAFALQGLNEISDLSTGAISIVTLNENMEEGSYRDIVYNVKDLPSGGYRLEFCDLDGGFQPRPNLVVKASLNQTTTLYAPLHLTQGAEPIFVDVNSHYVIRELIDNIETSSELNNLLADQVSAKANLLRALYITTDAFDIAFQDSDSLAVALDRLSGDQAYSVMVSQGIDEILNNAPSPAALGNLQGDSPTIGFETCFTDSRSYHSNYFRLGAVNLLPGDSDKELGYSASVSTTVPEGEVGNVAPLYPGIERTSYLYTSFQLETLAPEIPYESEWLIYDNGNFSRSSSTYFSFFSAISGVGTPDSLPLFTDTIMSVEGNILYDRAIPSLIPFNTSGSSSIGWSQNPVYSRLYQSNTAVPSFDSEGNCELEANSSAPWLTTAYYGSAKRYQQSNASGGTFSREIVQDQRELFTWEIHGLETNNTFSESDIQGNQFGVVSYAIKLDSSDPEVRVSADTWHWSANNFSMAQTQPSSHYESFTLDRTSAIDTVFTAIAPSAGTTNRTYFAYDEEQGPSQSPITNGLVGLDGGSRAPLGHSSQSGEYLSFVQDTVDKGRGLIIASALRSSSPVFQTQPQGGDNYLLQGNAIEMASEGNVMRNISGSSLRFYAPATGQSEDCSALITLEQPVVHKFTLGSEPLPVTIEDQLTALSSACTINGAEVELTFDSLLQLNETVRLKGFMSQSDNDDATPGNLINFLWIEENGLGLVFAQKEQDLNATR